LNELKLSVFDLSDIQIFIKN